MRRSYGYNSYRGRVTFQGFLRGLIIVLAVILILALVGYFLLQRYVVYTDQGQKFRFPFLAGEKDPSPSESVQIVVGGQESVSPEPTVSPVEEQPLQAVWLPLTALAQGTVEEQVFAAGGNAVILDMKLEDGSLGYHSQLELADQSGANAADEDGTRNEAIQALNRGTLYTVARVCCFKDDRLSDVDRAMNILTNSGYLWRDPDGVRWINPANEQVRAYLIGIARELAQLGFDEILLDFAGYPTRESWAGSKTGRTIREMNWTVPSAHFMKNCPWRWRTMKGRWSIRTTVEALTAPTDAAVRHRESGSLVGPDLVEQPEEKEDCLTPLRDAGVRNPEERLVWVLEGTGDGEESGQFSPDGSETGNERT